MNKSSNISALLITFNEIKHIEAVINNIDFANEIIVIDSFSTDGTFEALSKYSKVKTIQRPFKNFADQRNFAIQQAKNNWIMFIDADERITPELKDEILNEINNPREIVAFLFTRLYYFKQKRIRFSGFQTDKTYRLFKKDCVIYIEEKTVHEQPEIKGTSKVLKNKMIHYSFDSAYHYKQKMEHYASLKALELFRKGKKPHFFHFYIRPAYKFLVNYFIRFGILDGKEGFIICYLSAYGVYFRYQKLKKLFKS